MSSYLKSYSNQVRFGDIEEETDKNGALRNNASLRATLVYGSVAHHLPGVAIGYSCRVQVLGVFTTPRRVSRRPAGHNRVSVSPISRERGVLNGHNRTGNGIGEAGFGLVGMSKPHGVTAIPLVAGYGVVMNVGGRVAGTHHQDALTIVDFDRVVIDFRRGGVVIDVCPADHDAARFHSVNAAVLDNVIVDEVARFGSDPNGAIVVRHDLVVRQFIVPASVLRLPYAIKLDSPISLVRSNFIQRMRQDDVVVMNIGANRPEADSLKLVCIASRRNRAIPNLSRSCCGAQYLNPIVSAWRRHVRNRPINVINLYIPRRDVSSYVLMAEPQTIARHCRLVNGQVMDFRVCRSVLVQREMESCRFR